jgi:hypothetical protein
VTVVTCKVKGAKKPKVRCTVSFSAGASAASATVRLSRNGQTYARGRAPVENGRVRVRLRRGLAPGRYKLTVRVIDGSGAIAAASRPIRVG